MRETYRGEFGNWVIRCSDCKAETCDEITSSQHEYGEYFGRIFSYGFGKVNGLAIVEDL